MIAGRRTLSDVYASPGGMTLTNLAACYARRSPGIWPDTLLITARQLRDKLLIAHTRRPVYERFEDFQRSLDLIEIFLRPIDYLTSPIGECFLCR